MLRRNQQIIIKRSPFTTQDYEIISRDKVEIVIGKKKDRQFRLFNGDLRYIDPEWYFLELFVNEGASLVNEEIAQELFDEDLAELIVDTPPIYEERLRIFHAWLKRQYRSYMHLRPLMLDKIDRKLNLWRYIHAHGALCFMPCFPPPDDWTFVAFGKMLRCLSNKELASIRSRLFMLYDALIYPKVKNISLQTINCTKLVCKTLDEALLTYAGLENPGYGHKTEMILKDIVFTLKSLKNWLDSKHKVIETTILKNSQEHCSEHSLNAFENYQKSYPKSHFWLEFISS